MQLLKDLCCSDLCLAYTAPPPSFSSCCSGYSLRNAVGNSKSCLELQFAVGHHRRGKTSYKWLWQISAKSEALLFIVCFRHCFKRLSNNIFCWIFPSYESALPHRVMKIPKSENSNFWERLMFFMFHLLCVGMSAADSQKDNYFINKCKDDKQEILQTVCQGPPMSSRLCRAHELCTPAVSNNCCIWRAHKGNTAQ